MPTESLHAAKPSLAYAKLVATPTDKSWSQVYNAGNLFASLSLALEEPEEGLSLHSIGKSIVNNLEAEFFTLEEKNLHSIKAAIETSIKDIPPQITLSLCLTCFKDDILYLFIVGHGRIVMKRGEKIAVLLEKNQGHTQKIITASGYLNNNDMVVLETQQFATNISDETLTTALELALPNDIAEAISPQLHEKEDGGQAAIIIVYHGKTRQLPEPDEQEEETITTPYEEDLQENENTDVSEPSFKLPTLPPLPRSFPHLSLPQMNGVTHTKKLVISIIVVIAALLVIGLVFTKQQQESKKQQELFQTIYTPAQKNYEEGMELKSLNQNLSNKDFREAENMIQEGLSKFSKGSTEEKKLSELLTKVEKELGGPTETNTNTTKTKEASVSENDLLSVEKQNSAISFAQNANSVYLLTKNGVSSITSGKKKEVLKADDSWKNPVALAPYQGNLYILDTKAGVFKYVASGDGFAKSAYFKDKAPDLSKATAMAIDRSIWILLKDGDVLKYTSGAKDSFSIKDITKPLSNPTKLITNAEMSSVYILDKGNSRIVKLSKDGTFQKEYAASSVAQATDFEVIESDKKILILSSGKILEISME